MIITDPSIGFKATDINIIIFHDYKYIGSSGVSDFADVKAISVEKADIAWRILFRSSCAYGRTPHGVVSPGRSGVDNNNNNNNTDGWPRHAVSQSRRGVCCASPRSSRHPPRGTQDEVPRGVCIYTRVLVPRWRRRVQKSSTFSVLPGPGTKIVRIVRHILCGKKCRQCSEEIEKCLENSALIRREASDGILRCMKMGV